MLLVIKYAAKEIIKMYVKQIAENNTVQCLNNGKCSQVIMNILAIASA